LDCPFSEIIASVLQGIDVMLHLAAHTARPPCDTLENCKLYNMVQPLALVDKALIAGVASLSQLAVALSTGYHHSDMTLYLQVRS
jgi:hypothetical protein